MDMNKFSWEHLIDESNLPPISKHVLLVIGHHVNKYGDGCFPSVDRLMNLTGYKTKRVVTDAIKLAYYAGFVTVRRHGFAGKKWANHEYSIKTPDLDNLNERIEYINGRLKEFPSLQKVVTENAHVLEKVGTLMHEGGYSEYKRWGLSVQKVGTQSPPNIPKNKPIIDQGIYKEVHPVDKSVDNFGDVGGVSDTHQVVEDIAFEKHPRSHIFKIGLKVGCIVAADWMRMSKEEQSYLLNNGWYEGHGRFYRKEN